MYRVNRQESYEYLKRLAAKQRNALTPYEQTLGRLLLMDRLQAWHTKQPCLALCIADFYARNIKLIVSVSNSVEYYKNRLNKAGFHVIQVRPSVDDPSEAAERIYHRAKLIRALMRRRT